MSEVPSLIPVENGELHDFEVFYYDSNGSGTIHMHTVQQSKALQNALASFHRAVPRHGQIRRVRKVVPE